MWPDKATSRQSADRLARSLIEHRLVTVRDLPERSGRALILAAAGVRLLSEEGIVATSGKDIGRHTDQGWIPNLGWRHDLIAHGVLCELHKLGYEIYSEHEIRKWNLDLGKIPDGLAVSEEETFWIEVENARKSGKEMDRLAKVLSTVATQRVQVGDFIADTSLVAYVPGALSEAGHAINHNLRVRNAIATHASSDINIVWAECELLGSVGVNSVELYDDTIESENWRAIFKIMNKNWRWSDDKSELTVSYGDHFATIFTSDLSWMLSHPKFIEEVGSASSLSEAKVSIAMRILKKNNELKST